MSHAAQAGAALGPYVMGLHRERVARLVRMSPVPVAPPALVAPVPVVSAPPPIPRPTDIIAFPAYVFAGDCDRLPSDASRVNVREIQRLVCSCLNVRRVDLLSVRREHKVVLARQVAMYLIRSHTPRTYPEIGRQFGDRDHSTVIYAVSRITEIMAAPIGTGNMGRRWPVKDCDLVRGTVNLIESHLGSGLTR